MEMWKLCLRRGGQKTKKGTTTASLLFFLFPASINVDCRLQPPLPYHLPGKIRWPICYEILNICLLTDFTNKYIILNILKQGNPMKVTLIYYSHAALNILKNPIFKRESQPM